MQFIVPQFIEREPKIFGPFTFKQFIFVVIAVAILIFLYFTIKSFFLFLLLTILMMGAAFSLVLLKPGGVPLSTVLKNFSFFFFKPKIYLWRKKTFPVGISQEETKPKKEEREKKEKPILKITEKGHLKDLFTYLETKTK